VADSWLHGFQTIYCAMREVSIYPLSTIWLNLLDQAELMISTRQQKSYT